MTKQCHDQCPSISRSTGFTFLSPHPFEYIIVRLFVCIQIVLSPPLSEILSLQSRFCAVHHLLLSAGWSVSGHYFRCHWAHHVYTDVQVRVRSPPFDRSLCLCDCPAPSCQVRCASSPPTSHPSIDYLSTPVHFQ